MREIDRAKAEAGRMVKGESEDAVGVQHSKSGTAVGSEDGNASAA